MATFIGKPVTFTGKQLQVGDKAIDFTLTTPDLTKKSLSDFDGYKKVLSVVPSIDTGICSTQTRTFNKELSENENTVVITVSMDLPFAQGRWCGAAGLENAIMLSDYFDHSFGKDYALLMNEWHLLARAVLILDEENTIQYVEYLDNINSEPDYDKAVAALKNL
ncbi:MAG: thiol peroxidase [Streptococcus sp.]|nr:thiol peroxidase [Streptococcus sp.]